MQCAAGGPSNDHAPTGKATLEENRTFFNGRFETELVPDLLRAIVEPETSIQPGILNREMQRIVTKRIIFQSLLHPRLEPLYEQTTL